MAPGRPPTSDPGRSRREQQLQVGEDLELQRVPGGVEQKSTHRGADRPSGKPSTPPQNARGRGTGVLLGSLSGSPDGGLARQEGETPRSSSASNRLRTLRHGATVRPVRAVGARTAIHRRGDVNEHG
ncbi:hypothetical protein ACFPM0_26770 [Pseudonocardia sulfidoxydans]|uniref:hypothetical protein n=1 Tax=Pseudonocardia sulfidoxydans TaxID=54011 RepID=UPI003612232A